MRLSVTFSGRYLSRIKLTQQNACNLINMNIKSKLSTHCSTCRQQSTYPPRPLRRAPRIWGCIVAFQVGCCKLIDGTPGLKRRMIKIATHGVPGVQSAFVADAVVDGQEAGGVGHALLVAHLGVEDVWRRRRGGRGPRVSEVGLRAPHSPLGDWLHGVCLDRGCK